MANQKSRQEVFKIRRTIVKDIPHENQCRNNLGPFKPEINHALKIKKNNPRAKQKQEY